MTKLETKMITSSQHAKGAFTLMAIISLLGATFNKSQQQTPWAFRLTKVVSGFFMFPFDLTLI